ncbi:peroxisomal membrane protein 2-like [Stylonychia lemnae]|uniref:Peroxisomal membrane protein 2-like n=1 Tax=Stylonychia lemnae TaxID=5949 RepID=A0A078A3I8_STYLE|nr:peroxisomal membrane protein 2-like [Stylonychia lemnae]|eukprot:CDW76742.1 peroxisomal membrane protein 2-like [Stylonychia lemnae]
MRKLLDRYNACLARRPLFTGMISSGVIGGLGDILCQFIEINFDFKPDRAKAQEIECEQQAPSKKQNIDYHRSKSFFLLNTLWMSPIYFVHYTKVLPYLVPVVTSTSVFKKLVVDQLMLAPLYILSFYPVMNFIEGISFDQSKKDIEQKYWITLKSNMQTWGPASFINFYLMPVKYQLLFSNFVALFFNAYLSFMHNTYEFEIAHI